MACSKSNFYDLIVPLLVISSLMPMKFASYLVLFQILLLVIAFVYLNKVNLKRLVFCLLLFVFFVLLFIYNSHLDVKFVYLMLCAFLLSCDLDNQKLQHSFMLSFKFALVAIFFVSFLQKIFPLNIFVMLAENEGHSYLFQVGYSVYAFLGNSTHAAYITLVMGAYILFIGKNKFFYFLVTLFSLILFANKIAILVFVFLYLCDVFRKSKNTEKFATIIFAFLCAGMLWVLIFSHYYEQWSGTEIERIHTIAHRLKVFNYVMENLSDPLFWFFGNYGFVDDFSAAFDSGISLMFFKLGILTTILIYVFVFYGSGSFLISLAIALPSVTQVAFYNTQFILLISLIIISSKKA